MKILIICAGLGEPYDSYPMGGWEVGTNTLPDGAISNSIAQKTKINLTDEEVDTFTYSILEQNIPNPFNTTTLINFYLPSTVSAATIYVYDMNGVQLKRMILTK